MHEHLKGKKLLILGATASEKSIIDRAREMGVYTIVTDSNMDHKLSPSKDHADEYWDISWSDIDMLEKACREKQIDGVTAGYSEFRIENLIKLCSRLGLPCYCNEEQLEITRDKVKFKDACRKYKVPVIKEYGSVDEVDEFPVIVKPVDRAGSIGISIASNNAELQAAYDYAMKMSVCKQVIIEKFIENDTKFDVYYAVRDGEIIELSSCDTVNAKENGRERVVQSCWLYPSKYHGAFIKKCDESIRNMIKGLGIRFGCIFFSGFVNKSGEFSFFECGFRLEGAHQYKYTEKRGICDFNDFFIVHALTGSTDMLNSQYVINEKLKCAVVNLYAKKGTLSNISGLEEVRKLKNCDMALLRAYIGEKCDDSTAILTKLAQFEISSESPDEIAEDIGSAYELIRFEDENGSDMIYDRIDAEIARKWWNYEKNDILIKEYDGSFSYGEIQELLELAHRQNEKNGILYATAHQSVEKLIEKIGDGICLIAECSSDHTLAGTATVCVKHIDYWYYKGDILLIKLVGIHPDLKGRSIGTSLFRKIFEKASELGINVIVTDSAEKNAAFKGLALKMGFRIVDCVKYKANNFVSSVYALWMNDDCPWSDDEISEKYHAHRDNIEEKE